MDAPGMNRNKKPAAAATAPRAPAKREDLANFASIEPVAGSG
jgi:hypothetical protein